MKPCELVAKTIKGEDCGRTPVYGWVAENLTPQLTEAYGSVAAFEDHYAFDLAHLFGGPGPHNMERVEALRAAEGEVTPEAYLDIPLNPVDDMADYEALRAALEHHRAQRGRFCYVQTPGIFECLNEVFGIEDHLCFMALYPEALMEVYRRQARWNRRFALNVMELGMDMVHVSDDWGAQNSTMFSTEMWRGMIMPNHAPVAEAVKQAGRFLSLHSDGYVMPLVEEVIGLGYDVMHPWQESAGMDYQSWLDRYAGRLAIMGGLCIQTTLGFGDYERLEREIRRVFATLGGKRWICCTTHFVQQHCTLEELAFAYDLVVKLARP